MRWQTGTPSYAKDMDPSCFRTMCFNIVIPTSPNPLGAAPDNVPFGILIGYYDVRHSQMMDRPPSMQCTREIVFVGVEGSYRGHAHKSSHWSTGSGPVHFGGFHLMWFRGVWIQFIVSDYLYGLRLRRPLGIYWLCRFSRGKLGFQTILY